MLWRQIVGKIDTHFSWPCKHYFASKIVLQVIVSCLRGEGSMSSCPSFVSSYCFLRGTAGLSSCREIFLSLYPFPRGVAMSLFRRCVIFKSFIFGSSFPRLSYIQDSNRSAFPAFVARGSHRPKQNGEKGDGNRCPC